ncbi:S-adenosylmethionine:tRNA ribosyltransferase-isomerase [bacterium]|nr:S-adenosylmethionine:tRNA ribosyltransferase-isomerase [bacterium]
MGIPGIPLDYIDYELPADRIADRPLEQRSSSKLLRYRAGNMEDRTMVDLPELLAPHSTLFLNESKVVPARLFFPLPKDDSGLDVDRPVEVFCLGGADGTPLHVLLERDPPIKVEAMVGGVRRWNARGGGKRLVYDFEDEQGACTVQARLSQGAAAFPTVELEWSPAGNLRTLLERIGHVPLPPYMRRPDGPEDKERYQTVFAQASGSVAAPTAGLHLDPPLLDALQRAGHRTEPLILHVGAGTFLPIKSERSDGHIMHREWIEVSRPAIETLAETPFEHTLAIGTTALRTLESLYWFGVREIESPGVTGPLTQEFPYQTVLRPPKKQALEALLSRMERGGLDRWTEATGLFLLPGIDFHCAGQLLTNFHQPKSSLLFLVDAYIGPAWKKVYQHALDHRYRFLSYGDACLFQKTLV